MRRAIVWISILLVAGCSSSVRVDRAGPEVYTATADVMYLLPDELIPARRTAYERAVQECNEKGKELLVVDQSLRYRPLSGNLVSDGVQASITFECVGK